MNLLLAAAISLAALGLIVAVVLWLRDRRGRAVQALGFAALPIGLHLTGLLGLVFDAVVAVARWAGDLVFNPVVWTGVGLLGLAVVLWVVGGFVARRSTAGRGVERTPVDRCTLAQPSQPPAKGRSAADDSNEYDEIEALLRKRGIE